MKKKIIIIIVCGIILIAILLGIVFLRKNNTREQEKIENVNNSPVITNTQKKVIEVIEDVTIQGIVEIHHNGFIYMFNGIYFGEYGLEMEEYSIANINENGQKCVDFYTSEEHDLSYIEEGDILICTGDLKKYSYGEADMDTKDNNIIVLKNKNYANITKEALIGKRETTAKIEAYYGEEIYIKYTLIENGYNLPFARKFYITDDTKIIGTLEKGKKVKIDYTEANISGDDYKLKKIECIDD